MARTWSFPPWRAPTRRWRRSTSCCRPRRPRADGIVGGRHYACAMPVLSADGISLVVDVAGPRLPRIRHFGADPGPLDADLLDVLVPLAGDLPLLPSAADNWFGRPALSGHRQGVSVPVRWTLDEPVTVEPGEGGR